MAIYRAFGLTLDSRFELPGMRAVDPPDGEHVSLALATEAELAAAWSGAEGPPTWVTRFPDGNVVRVETGVEGDQRIQYGELAEFWLSAEADAILCSPRLAGDAAWQRFLLDTVLWGTALRRGSCLVHACGIEHPTGVVAISSQMGGGKTTLGLELLRRGYPLFCDDVLVLAQTGGGVVAEPGPPFMNVPAGVDDAAAFGHVLASLEDETWLAVERVSRSTLPLAALFLYTRAADLPLEARLTETSVIDLVPQLFLPVDGLDRERFNLLSTVAERVPVFHLTAPADASAQAVSDIVESVLEESAITV